MGAISRPHDYTTGVVDADECNDNEDLLYNTINGELDAANIEDNSLTNAEMTTAAKPELRDFENFQDRVYAGCSVSTGGTAAPLVATVATGTAYVKGVRVTPASASHTCATSTTTYLDLSSAGTFSWNNAGLATDSMRLYTIVTDASSITPAPTDTRTLCAVGAVNIEDNACTDIISANETTVTGIVTTSPTTGAHIIDQTISVLAGDKLDIHGWTSLAASTTCTPRASVYVGGALQYPVSQPNLVGTVNQAIPFDVCYTVATNSTALPVNLILQAEATTTTGTAKNSIVTIIRHRR